MIDCDGHATNFSADVMLGADFTVGNLKPYFAHPNVYVYVVFDAAHITPPRKSR